MNKTIAKLKRLQNRLAGASDQAVEIPYEIECDCGASVKGVRRATWIEAECTSCAAAVFVLPMNVYPSTKSVPSEILGGTFRERLSVVTKELVRGKNADPEEEPAKAKKNQKVDTAEDEAAVPVRKWRLPSFSLPRIDFKRLLARTFSPFRLLMMAVIVTVGLTGWFMIQKRQTEHAQKVWLEATETIAGKLDQQNLNGLLPELETAIAAGTTLGKTGPEFRRLRNLRTETLATDTLAAAGLVDVFQAAYDAENRIKPQARLNIQEACDQGWFLFDAVATKTKSNTGIDWLIDFPATPGLHPVSIVLPNLVLTQDLETNDNSRLLFVAKLSVQTAPSNDEDGQWLLKVNPDNFALLTHAAQCKAVGFDVENDEALKQLIEQQAEWVKSGSSAIQAPPTSGVADSQTVKQSEATQ